MKSQASHASNPENMEAKDICGLLRAANDGHVALVEVVKRETASGVAQVAMQGRVYAQKVIRARVAADQSFHPFTTSTRATWPSLAARSSRKYLWLPCFRGAAWLAWLSSISSISSSSRAA